MLNNMNSNPFKNIAGIAKGPSNIGGVNQKPMNISGVQKMPTQNNPFSGVKTDRQLSKPIMNSSGENVIRNSFNKGGGYHGN